MRRRMRNMRELKVRRYADLLIDLNEYLYEYPGAKAIDKIGDMELDEILLNSIANGWSKQAYWQDLYCETIT